MISAHTLVTVQLVWRQGLRALSDSAAAVVLAVTCLPFFVPVTRVREFFLVPSLDSPASRAAATADGSVVLVRGACDRTPVGPSRSTVRGACPARATSCPAAPRGAMSGPPPAFLHSSVHSHRGSPSGPVPACATAGLPGLFLPSNPSAPSCPRPGCSGSPTPRSPAAWSSGGSAHTVLSPRPRLPFHRSPVLTSQLPMPGSLPSLRTPLSPGELWLCPGRSHGFRPLSAGSVFRSNPQPCSLLVTHTLTPSTCPYRGARAPWDGHLTATDPHPQLGPRPWGPQPSL